MAQGYAMGDDGRVLPPHGLEEIVAAFGNIHDYIYRDGSLDPRWQGDFLLRMALPFPMVLSWDHTQSVTEMTCHKKLVDVFGEVFAQVRAQGLEAKVQSFGGCFSFRQQRTGSKLSTHAWGIAVDLNPETNAQGTNGDMDESVIEIFQAAGFEWGGGWPGRVKDPMHFQYCSGY